MAAVTAIRTVRSEYGVDPKRRVDMRIVAGGDGAAALREASGWIRTLARLEAFDVLETAPAAEAGTIRQPVGGWEIHVPLSGLFDVAAERTRLSRELEKVRAELEGLGKRLQNPQFVDRAKPEVVAEARREAGRPHGARGEGRGHAALAGRRVSLDPERVRQVVRARCRRTWAPATRRARRPSPSTPARRACCSPSRS